MGQPVAMPPSPLAAGEKIPCVSYAPFRGDQTPLDPATRIPGAQIDEDFAALKSRTGCVRTYSIEHALDQIPGLARKHGLKVIQGIWLSSNPVSNRREIDGVVNLVRQYPDVISSVIVGNEVLLRGEMSGADLAALIREVKARVGVPVTYADVWEFWLRHREVYEAVDFVTIHILPYWEDFPIAARDAASHVDSIRRKMAAAFPGKDILIGETGFPSQGRMREGALPTPANQARAARAAGARQARRTAGQPDRGVRPALEAWARRHGRRVLGAARYLSSRREVFMGRACLQPSVVGAAGDGRRGAGPRGRAGRHGGRAAQCAAAGRMGRRVRVRGRGRFHGAARDRENPARKLHRRRLAAVAGDGARGRRGAAAVRRRACPRRADARLCAGAGAARGRLRDPLRLALGLSLIAATVLALHVALGQVFDPRYREFHYAPLTAAIVPFAVLA